MLGRYVFRSEAAGLKRGAAKEGAPWDAQGPPSCFRRWRLGMNKAFFSATNFERINWLRDRLRALGDEDLIGLFEALYIDFMSAYKRCGEGYWVEDPTVPIIFEEYGPYLRKVGRGRRRK